jgi:hypothetical protein
MTKTHLENTKDNKGYWRKNKKTRIPMRNGEM